MDGSGVVVVWQWCGMERRGLSVLTCDVMFLINTEMEREGGRKGG